MKKIIQRLLAVFILLTCVAVILNVNVTTRQGVNYQLYTIKIPLYLKILDFFDRHYNYRLLVKRIAKGAVTDEERLMRIFEWTHANIRKVPEGFPVIDDHVWHIIIRGYGARDQSSDVFTTLCNYAGINAFFFNVYLRDGAKKRVFSFARLSGRWYIFDPYSGIYFKDAYGKMVDVDTIRAKGAWQIEGVGEVPEINYVAYLDNLPPISDPGFARPNLQSPLRRILYQISKGLK